MTFAYFLLGIVGPGDVFPTETKVTRSCNSKIWSVVQMTRILLRFQMHLISWMPMNSF